MGCLQHRCSASLCQKELCFPPIDPRVPLVWLLNHWRVTVAVALSTTQRVSCRFGQHYLFTTLHPCLLLNHRRRPPALAPSLEENLQLCHEPLHVHRLPRLHLPRTHHAARRTTTRGARWRDIARPSFGSLAHSFVDSEPLNPPSSSIASASTLPP